MTSANTRSSEFCIDSPKEDSLLLYLEAVRTPEMRGVGKALLHYDVAPVAREVMQDPMEGQLLLV